MLFEEEVRGKVVTQARVFGRFAFVLHSDIYLNTHKTKGDVNESIGSKKAALVACGSA